MNKVLKDIIVTGLTKVEDGTLTPVHSAIGHPEIELIDRIIRNIRPNVSLEIGMAYGVPL